MSRPLLPADKLKHPRHTRKSTVQGKQLDVPTPSKALKEAWKPVIDAALACLVENDRKDNIAKKTRMYLSFLVETKPPARFPVGRVEKKADGTVVRSYNAEQVLLWAWERKLADVNPTMFYAKLRKYNMEIREMLDFDKFLNYNDK